MTTHTELGAKVEELNQRAKKFQQEQNTDEEVETAKRSLAHHNDELRTLRKSVKSLRRMTGILTTVFEREPPGEVVRAQRRLDEIASRDQAALLDQLEDGTIMDADGDVRDVNDEVQAAKRAVQSELSDIRDQWQSDIKTARAILRITGGDEIVEDTLDDIESFVQTDIWRETKPVSSLRNRWQRLSNSWEQDTVDWESFQREHDLSNQTISVLKRLSNGEKVTIMSAGETVLNELDDVDALRRQIYMKV